MKMLCLALASISLGGCEDKTREAQQDLRLSQLENITHDLQVNELIADEQPPAVSAPQPGYDLVVKWPAAASAEHRVYPSRDSCETARAVILADNKRKSDAAEAEVGTVNPAGQRIIAVGAPAMPTALCVPVG